MSWKKIGIYYLAFVVLAAYYFMGERQPQPLFPQEEAKAILNIPASEVREIALRRATGTIVCRRDNGQWKVINPPHARVPSDLIAAIIDNLTHNREIELVTEGAEDLSAYGLDFPRTTLTMTAGRGDRPLTLFLGGKNPTQTAVYARLDGSPRVFLIGLNVRVYEDLLFEGVGMG